MAEVQEGVVQVSTEAEVTAQKVVIDDDRPKTQEGTAAIESAQETDTHEAEEETATFQHVDESASEDSDSEDDFSQVISDIKQGKEEKSASDATSSARSGTNSMGQAPVVDDFIRNFLIKNNMQSTLESFQSEWYELQSKGKLSGDTAVQVPEVYAQYAALQDEVSHLRVKLEKARSAADKARGSWDSFRKERDFHRMHHRRVVQEKNKLLNDMKRLKKHYAKLQPTIKQLRKKYEDMSKEKMLVIIERDKLRTKLRALQEEGAGAQGSGAQGQDEHKSTQKKKKATSKPKTKGTPFPPDSRVNPNLNKTFDLAEVQSFGMVKTFHAHDMAISGLALHPEKPIAATVSDDHTWKLWSIPQGELVMSGTGHKDWLSDCEFHPRGHLLATSSADGTVKLWDFQEACCRHTFTEHNTTVWSISFHDTGDFLASAAMDHTVRLWDLKSQTCRQTFRGHVDSVNSVCWQPFSNNLCTASGDKTVSMWDLRSGLCIQTFYGHANAVNHTAFNVQGDLIVSGDANGVVKVWDVRMVGERAHIDTCEPNMRIPANEVRIHHSGERIVVASDVGSVSVYNLNGEHLGDLEGHEGPVQAATFDPSGQFLVSGGSDGNVKMWAS